MVSLEHTPETASAGHSARHTARARRGWLALLATRLTRLHTHTWIVLGLMLLGAGLRFWFIAVNELQPQYSPADDGDYYQRALRFATTGQYIDDFWLIRPPLHVFLFAGMIRLSIIFGGVHGIDLIRLLQTAMIVLTIPMGYSIARRLFNPRAGLLMAGFLAVWFPLVELPVHLFSEPSFFFFLVVHLWLLVLWRDLRRWPLLAASGMALGLAALARSPTIYGGAFVLLWLLLDRIEQARANQQALGWLRPRTWLPVLRAALRPIAIFTLACALLVVPWTIRNYMVYNHFILIDTIGPVNLWLHLEKYEARGVEILKTMPQAERQPFAVADVRRMFTEDPVGFVGLLFRNADFHFMHIWKAQFVEDFFVKRSFYGRPLREMWPLGVAGDLIWFVFTLGGLLALAAPLREGSFRVIGVLWISYTVFAMMIMHIEPRYLLPIWLFLALYACWALSSVGGLLRTLRQHRWNGLLALLLATVFLTVFFTYRNYPEIISRGIAREMHNAAGMQAFAAGDYATAARELEAAVETQSTFTETRANLALVYAAQGREADAWEVLGDIDSQRMSIVRGALERAEGDARSAETYFTDAETRAGEDAQQFALRWLPTAPRSLLNLGDGLDLGYVAGFSPGERSATDETYRWLQGSGRVRLPLEQPLAAGDVLLLRMTSGQPAAVPLTLTFVHGEQREQRTFAVQSGRWRIYRLTVPAEVAGAAELDIQLDAPIFIPAHIYDESIDVRPLSLMLSAVWIEPSSASGETHNSE